MEDNLLKELSQYVLVIPLDDETTEELSAFCEAQLQHIGVERFSELVMCAILKQRDEKLHDALAEYAKDKETLSALPLEVLEPIIAQYLFMEAINQEEDSLKKSVYSLMLMNAMLIVVKRVGNVACPKKLVEYYNTYKNFLTEERTYETNNKNDLINDYFKNYVDKDAFKTEAKDKLHDLKGVFFDAARYRYDALKGQLIGSHESDNAFVRAYQIVCDLVKNTPWVFVEQEAEETLLGLIGEAGENVHSTIDQITHDVKEVDPDIEDGDFQPSSVLLNYMSGGIDGREAIGKVTLTPLEFAVYLYYELLCEKILEQYIEEDEL